MCLFLVLCLWDSATNRLGICRGTPGALSTLGFILLGLAAAAIVVIPDDGAGLIVAQSAVAGALGGGGVAALAGGNLVASLQKD